VLRDPRRRVSERIDVFGFFVSLAAACRQIGNYHAVFALVGGLSSPLLAWVADIAHRKDKHALNSLKRLVRPDNNYRVYWADLTKCEPDKPHIPYLGLLNRSLLALECDAPVWVGEEVNFLRCRKIWSAVLSFLEGQRAAGAAEAGGSESAVVVHPSVRRALAASMSRTLVDYVGLSEMSALAKAAFMKSGMQRVLHGARTFGHQLSVVPLQ
jgi:hypothetical protein